MNRSRPLAVVLAFCVCLSAQAELPSCALARLGDEGDTDRMHGVYQLAFSPDGTKVATRSNDQVVRVYQLPSGEFIHQLDGYEDGRVTDLIFSYDSRSLLTMSSERSEALIVWDVASGKETKRLPFWCSFIRRMASPPYYAMARQNQLRTFSIDEKDPVNQGIETLTDRGLSESVPLDCSEDFRQILFYAHRLTGASAMRNAYLLNLNTNRNAVFPFEQAIRRARIFPDGKRIAAILRNDNRLHIRAAMSTSRSSLALHNGELTDLCFSPDGRHLAVVGVNGRLTVIEAASNQSISSVESTGDEQRAAIHSVAFSADGRTVATGYSGKNSNGALLWDFSKILFSDSDKPSVALDVHYRELASTSARTAYAAMAALLADPDVTLDMIEDKTNISTDVVSPAAVARWIDDLDDPKHAVRQLAFEQLLIVNGQFQEQIAAAYENARSLESRIRLKRIVDAANSQVTSKNELRQWLRVIYVLELLDSQRSDRILQSIVNRKIHREVTNQATAALRRRKRSRGDPS